MTKEQRFRYEMFVRVRDFGTANRALFPESSTGGATFDTIASAVTEVEQQLTRRDLARAESQRVNATMRRSVIEAMQAIARTARRVTAGNPGVNPFKMPSRKSSPAVLSRARLFVEQASVRQDEFIRFGMPATFVRDLERRIDQLEQAVTVRLNSRSSRRRAQSGIETALTKGFAGVLDLDAIVANALRLDPVRLAEWQGARHIQGATPAAAPAASRTADAAPDSGDTPTGIKKVS